MALTSRIAPAVRRKDVRVALVVDTLPREPLDAVRPWLNVQTASLLVITRCSRV